MITQVLPFKLRQIYNLYEKLSSSLDDKACLD